MADDFIKYAFSAGVLAPKLWGRSDLEKYDLGLAEGMNWFVDFQGGISTRPGTEFVDYTLFNEKATKFFPFRFAPNVANTYVVLFSNGAVHFFQDGAPVVEATVTGITNITQANPGVVTRAAHGLANGDRIILDGIVGMTELNGREVQVAGVTANTFQLRLPIATVTNLNTTSFTAYSSGGEWNRIYSITSPYADTDLDELRAYQIRDTLRLTHPDFPIKNLTRTAHTSWSITDEVIGNHNSIPSGVAITASGAGTASVGFVITAVNQAGEESLGSTMEVIDSIVNYPTTAGSVTVTWNAIDNVKYYNVYRTVVLPESDTGASADATVTRAEQVGYVGQTFAPRFVDPNIIPDFTRTPPLYTSPFENESIEQINITAGGAGYPVDSTVSASVGTGFRGFPIVDPSGAIISVVVERGGTDYGGTTISFAGGAGAGATADANVTPSSGNYPSISCVAQQRQIYAASDNDPLTLWWSRAGYFSHFDISQISSDADSIEFEIDSEEVAPIRHLVEVQSGVLVMSKTGVWLLRGEEGKGITANDALADPQNYRGVSEVPPIKIDSDLLYIEGKGNTVRLLTNYSDLTKKYAGQNVSILSNHFFTSINRIIAWSFASNPYNLVWAVRADGKFLPFTFVKEQDVYAWSIAQTEGLVTDCCTVEENGIDSTYLAVRRYIGGSWRKYIERLRPRPFNHVEDSWCVDCGLRTDYGVPNALLTIAAATGTNVLFTTDVATFNSGHVGAMIRAGGGKAEITQFNSNTSVNATIIRPITDVLPESGRPVQQPFGSWTLTQQFSSVSRAWHLEGESVQVLADGNVLAPKTVVNGSFALGDDYTRVLLGMKFTCVARTLPFTADGAVIEGKKKRPVGLMVRVVDTVGLKVGDTLASADLYGMHDAPYSGTLPVGYTEPTPLQEAPQFAIINAPFDVNGQVYMVQDQPLPATVVGIVTTLEVGDVDR